MEQNYKKRIRVNFSVSTKGIVTPDITVEMIDTDDNIVLKEAAILLDSAIVIARERSV